MADRRRLLKNSSSQREIKDTNEEVAKAIRKDVRTYKHNKIMKTIEDKKSWKVLRQRLTTGKKKIINLRNKDGETTSNRKEMLIIVE